MTLVVRNANFSITFSLTCLKILGLWAPEELTGWKRSLYNCYTALVFMFALGIYLITQLVDLCLIWGNLPLMTATAFVLFTNLVHAVKIINLLARRKNIQQIVDSNDRMLQSSDAAEIDIIKRCDRGTNIHLFIFFSLTTVTLFALAAAAATESTGNTLPLRAWYPYNASKSPAYELTYLHQMVAIYTAALLNVSKDLLVVSLVAQCRCRLKLVSHRLRNLDKDLRIDHERFTRAQEEVLTCRMRSCVSEHQATLAAVVRLQRCFSEPTFAQFTVSLVIICVTAFQLTFQIGKWVRMVSMASYLLNMMEQVFIYCYEGNELTAESERVAEAAYSWAWYCSGARLRGASLHVATRCARAARLHAAGLTALSLTSFRNILKASYTFFTVLRQVDDRS